MRSGTLIGLYAALAVVGCSDAGEAAGSAPPAARSGAPQAAASAESFAGWVEEVKRDPQMGAPWRVLEATFPADYAQLMAETRAAAAASSEAEAKTAAFAAMRRLAVSKRDLVIKAPDADLAIYLAAQEQAGRTFQAADPESCMAMFGGDVRTVREFNGASLGALAELTAALFAAAAAGRDRPVTRDVTLDDSDYAAWGQAMREAGATKETLALITDREAQARASAAELCQMRVVMLAGVNRLPPPRLGRFGAALMGAGPAPAG